MVSVVQREWAAKNPRTTFQTPITVDDVLNSRMIAYAFRILQCCLVTDGGGASTRKIATLAWYVVGETRQSGWDDMRMDSIFSRHISLFCYNYSGNTA